MGSLDHVIAQSDEICRFGLAGGRSQAVAERCQNPVQSGRRCYEEPNIGASSVHSVFTENRYPPRGTISSASRTDYDRTLIIKIRHGIVEVHKHMVIGRSRKCDAGVHVCYQRLKLRMAQPNPYFTRLTKSTTPTPIQPPRHRERLGWFNNNIRSRIAIPNLNFGVGASAARALCVLELKTPKTCRRLIESDRG